MRKLARLLVIAILFIPALFSIQGAARSIFRPAGSSPGDYYQVIFDAEGEASVLALLTRLNTGTEVTEEVVLEIPGQVNIRYVFQEVSACRSECVRHEQQCAEQEVVCTSWDDETSTCNAWGKRCKRYESVCVEWEERCYGWQKTYAPLNYDTEPLSKSVRYTLHLKQPIKQAGTATILIYYKASGYVSPLINYDFDFETAKGPYDIEYVRVAIATDSELYLRGAGTKTDYRQNIVQFETYAKDASVSPTPQSAEALRGYVSNIRYVSGYIREKRGLDPWESFHVYGSYNYANLWFLTYFWEIIVGLVALILFKLFAWDHMKRLISHAFWGEEKEKPVPVPEKEVKKTKEPIREGRFTRIAFAGLVSALATLAVSWVIFNLFTPLLTHFGYPFTLFFGMLMLVVSGALILIALGAPAVWMWRHYDLYEGILTVVSAVIWMFVLLVVVAMFFSTEPVIIRPLYEYAKSIAVPQYD